MEKTVVGARTKREWFVVQTKPKQEYIAEEHLCQRGYDVYLPRMTARQNRRRRSRPVVEPLFPGYLFLHVDIQHENTAPVLSTKGVKSFVRFGDRYPPVPDGVIEQILQFETKMMESPESECFRRGERVEIRSGPFSGIQGVFNLERGRDRAMVLIQLLGSAREVCVDTTFLEPVR